MSVGDIILDLERFEAAFEHVTPVLRQADFLMASFDQCFSDLDGSPNRYWPTHYGAPPDSAAMLRPLVAVGLNVLNFGNNHSLDWGDAIETFLVNAMANAE